MTTDPAPTARHAPSGDDQALRSNWDPWDGTPTDDRMSMAEAEAAAPHDRSRRRHGVGAGEPLPADTLAAITRSFGVTPLDGIGMSECRVYCSNRAGRPIRPGPGPIIELMDQDMSPVAPRTAGGLCVRPDTHPGRMKGYRNRPEPTAPISRGDGYDSGDVLVRDEQGDFRLHGRSDDRRRPAGTGSRPSRWRAAWWAIPRCSRPPRSRARTPRAGRWSRRSWSCGRGGIPARSWRPRSRSTSSGRSRRTTARAAGIRGRTAEDPIRRDQARGAAGAGAAGGDGRKNRGTRPFELRVRERMGWDLRYSEFTMRKILGTRGLEPIRNPECVLRNGSFHNP